jgi:hypothetical protein
MARDGIKQVSTLLEAKGLAVESLKIEVAATVVRLSLKTIAEGRERMRGE